MTKIDLNDGKYTVIHENGVNLHALRHGKPWRDLPGDGLILSLVQRVEELEELCAEAYQVVGILAVECGRFGADDTDKILDNLSQLKMLHSDVLPFASKDTT